MFVLYLSIYRSISHFFYLSLSLSIYLSLFSLSLSFSSPVFHVFRFSLSLSLILSLTFGKIVPFIPENIGFNLTYTVTRIHRLCWFSLSKARSFWVKFHHSCLEPLELWSFSWGPLLLKRIWSLKIYIIDIIFTVYSLE